MRLLLLKEGKLNSQKSSSQDLISLVRNCQHLNPKEMKAGRKHPILILFCPDCGLVLDMKEAK